MRFAALNACPEVARAELEVYYVTLDGFGQQRKHLLLLQETLPAGGGALQERFEGDEGDNDDAGGGEVSGERDVEEEEAAAAAGAVPNRLIAHLGPGLTAMLQDLFMQAGGPNLRGKVSHGEAALMDREGEADGEGGAWLAPAAYRLVIVAALALAARERAQARPSWFPDTHVAYRVMKARQGDFHTGALV